jgi:3-oxoacyl-[acyl-carrier protein] reductase
MALQFAGRHCVVVGATGVIGSSIAKAFAHHGAVVSLLGRSAVQVRHKLEPQLRPYSLPETGDGTGSAATAAADGIPSAHRFIRLDVSNREEIKALFSSRTLPSKVIHLYIHVKSHDNPPKNYFCSYKPPIPYTSFAMSLKLGSLT